MSNRRTFLQTVSTLPVIGSLVPASLAAAAVTKRDYFKDLNVGTFINAAGTYTTLTASLMHPEVVAASFIVGMRCFLPSATNSAAPIWY